MGITEKQKNKKNYVCLGARNTEATPKRGEKTTMQPIQNC